MKIIDDIFASIAGNAKTKINDPFIGTFICSWIVCNWNHLSLLFWGDGKVTERIGIFYDYLSETPKLEWNQLLTIPLTIAFSYLFFFPWLSMLINFLQHWANEQLHKQAVDRELIKIEQQKKLNKEKLKANPNKKFLEQLIQQDIDKQNEILEHIKQRRSRLEAKTIEAREKAKEQEAKTQEAASKASLLILDLEKKEKQAALEKIRFESDSAKARATHASHRFPSAYFLMLKIEKSLSEDAIKISLNALGSIVAALFGYETFEELLNDKNFNNEVLEKVEYVYYDDNLAKRLEQIVLDENSDNEDFSADLIFNHIEILFEDIPFKLIAGDNLADECKEEFEKYPYDIFNSDGTSGAIAESNSFFDNVEDISIEDFYFDNGFYTELAANARGHHYKEEGVPGRSMTVSIIMQCDVLVGKFGLGSIEQGEVNGTLDDYG
ncbi:hypothetical protein H5A40_00940 [Pectobacterium brasiliense]|uniref:hypothetical protein n=1 Tax=Pectobacterium brasiliense TaxID=180957 RepID=UPI0019693065|nr:hypothetical protein [Pectobacterium brasiliense]MBN7764351.1 hypothetical protein [Pectobacterium brasiliense]QSD35772.1 hypothetical protein H5A40_00940 [Pectobacterium brasiliense]